MDRKMKNKEKFSILLFFFAISVVASSKDGFNAYKDFLRAKFDDEDLYSPDDVLSDKVCE